MGETIKAFKGFNQKMMCRDFQYEEGKEYETDRAEVCNTGFHACEYPLDCFRYYSPNESIYHEVEQSGDLSRANDKISSTKIKIGIRLGIADLVKAAIDFTMARVKPEAKSDERCGASSATGDYGASSATGYYGASSATGDCCSAEANDPCAIAVAWGYKGRAKGVKGARIVLADWEGDEKNYWTQSEWDLKGAKMVKIDGKKYKPDTWYTMKNGQIVKWEEEL